MMEIHSQGITVRTQACMEMQLPRLARVARTQPAGTAASLTSYTARFHTWHVGEVAVIPRLQARLTSAILQALRKMPAAFAL